MKPRLDFHPDLPIDLQFCAPEISTDGGLLLLRQAEEELGICRMLAACVPDSRDARRTRHSRREQLEQSVFQIALGYEDCNDAHWLRHDPMFKCAAGLMPDDARALSSQPTLSRFENACDEQALTRM